MINNNFDFHGLLRESIENREGLKTEASYRPPEADIERGRKDREAKRAQAQRVAGAERGEKMAPRSGNYDEADFDELWKSLPHSSKFKQKAKDLWDRNKDNPPGLRQKALDILVPAMEKWHTDNAADMKKANKKKKKTDSQDAKPEKVEEPQAPDGSDIDMIDKLATKYLNRPEFGGVATKTIRGMINPRTGNAYSAKETDLSFRDHPVGSVYSDPRGTTYIINKHDTGNGNISGYAANNKNVKLLDKMKNLISIVVKDLKSGALKEISGDGLESKVDEVIQKAINRINENNK